LKIKYLRKWLAMDKLRKLRKLKIRTTQVIFLARTGGAEAHHSDGYIRQAGGQHEGEAG
jgi:hypothetical protein